MEKVGQKSKNNNLIRKDIKKISERVMVATLASSIVMMPILGARVDARTSNYSTSSLSLRTMKNIGTAVSILDSKGSLESANVEWNAVQGATGYNVYYKSANEGDSQYKKLDDKLIRQYPAYFRADAIGLSEGSYVMKIVPIVNNQEASSEQAITKSIQVKAHTREGFAFSSESPMKTGSGGYNNDGTIPANAKVVYITADNANTVTTDVITNAKGTKVTCTGLTDILTKRQKGYDKTPLIIRMVGELKSSDIKGLNSTGYLQLKGCYNVTFEGVGEDATAYGWGILVRDAHNVEIRNIGVMLFPDDGISLDTDNENIWVHNNDIFYGAAGHDADQVKGDGSTDTKKSDYITLSYNHYYDSGKCSLCGMADTKNFHVTYHHNWFDHSDSRHPRIRVGTVHVYNNYFDGNSKYGVGVTKASSAFVEANYFRNCPNPMLSSMQGSDIEDGIGTFSKEPGGMIKAYNNTIIGAKSVVYANENATQFDAYLTKTRNEAVPSTYKTLVGGSTYNNFDTSATMYKYAPDDPANVPNNVTTYAGRVNGGDFLWKFTNADDADHLVNNALMNKLRNYKTDLVSVGNSSVSK
jgi:pectate lyase